MRRDECFFGVYGDGDCAVTGQISTSVEQLEVQRRWCNQYMHNLLVPGNYTRWVCHQLQKMTSYLYRKTNIRLFFVGTKCLWLGKHSYMFIILEIPTNGLFSVRNSFIYLQKAMKVNCNDSRDLYHRTRNAFPINHFMIDVSIIYFTIVNFGMQVVSTPCFPFRLKKERQCDDTSLLETGLATLMHVSSFHYLKHWEHQFIVRIVNRRIC